MKIIKRIYIKLFEEGLNVWKPVEAIKLGGSKYKRLEDSDYSPETEAWEFALVQ